METAFRIVLDPADTGSFGSASASLCEADAALRMTLH